MVTVDIKASQLNGASCSQSITDDTANRITTKTFTTVKNMNHTSIVARNNLTQHGNTHSFCCLCITFKVTNGYDYF